MVKDYFISNRFGSSEYSILENLRIVSSGLAQYKYLLKRASKINVVISKELGEELEKCLMKT